MAKITPFGVTKLSVNVKAAGIVTTQVPQATGLNLESTFFCFACGKCPEMGFSRSFDEAGNCAECSTEFTPMIGFLRSRFDQGQAMVAHPAPGVEDAQQEMEIYLASFA